MKAELLYESDEKAMASERFLSKDELRRIFGTGIEISMTITRKRKRFKRHREITKHSKTAKEERYLKREYPKFTQKSRMISI
jgi:hypothetical protein